jgi:hypothetical protein
MLLDEANHLTFLKISDISFIRIEQVPFQLAEALSEGEISAIDAIEPLGKIGLRNWTLEVEKQISESTNLNVEITFHEGLDLETEASRLNCQVALTYMLSTVQGWSGDEETIGLIKGKLKSIELSNSDTTLSDGVLSLMVSDEIKSNSKANFTEKVESLF